MKFNDKVLDALSVLVDAAENDYELYRICNLVRDLAAPPKFEQIDDNHQSFNGKNYHKDRKGYYVSTRYDAVHIATFKYFCGDIPAGYEIHHKDFNKDNNDVSNLQLLTTAEHAKLHQMPRIETRICKGCGKEFLGQPDAAHRKGSRSTCSDECLSKLNSSRQNHRPPNVCIVCGKEFKTKHKETHTCSKECAKKLSTTEVTCLCCGKKFTD